MKNRPLVGGFNKEWAKKAGKAKFVEQHKHLASKEVLEAEFDKIVPPTEKK